MHPGVASDGPCPVAFRAFRCVQAVSNRFPCGCACDARGRAVPDAAALQPSSDPTGPVPAARGGRPPCAVMGCMGGGGGGARIRAEASFPTPSAQARTPQRPGTPHQQSRRTERGLAGGWAASNGALRTGRNRPMMQCGARIGCIMRRCGLKATRSRRSLSASPESRRRIGGSNRWCSPEQACVG